jgi:AbrB family looped-hinge helix DNA binding protein
MSSTTVSLRDRRQITLPADVVTAMGLVTNDTLEVRVVNGGILLVPTHGVPAPQRSMSRFVGAARGVYGQTAEEADALVRELRDSW